MVFSSGDFSKKKIMSSWWCQTNIYIPCIPYVVRFHFPPVRLNGTLDVEAATVLHGH